MKRFIFLAFLGFAMAGNAQVGIGANPHSSAQLDVTSTTKGILVPRLTAAQKSAIPSPATGLLIYQTDNLPGFYCFNGLLWYLIGGSGNYVDLTTDQSVAGSKTFISDVNINTLTIGLGAGNISTNTAIGANALPGNTTGNLNVAIGPNTLKLNGDGSGNIAIGPESLIANTDGGYNIGIGLYSLTSNVSGFSNTAVGTAALRSTTGSNGNTAIGGNALAFFSNGEFNTAIGAEAMGSGTLGSRNAANGAFALYHNSGSENSAIGYYAIGFNETGNGNTAIGNETGYNNVTGNQNTYVGNRTGLGIIDGSYNTILGANVSGLDPSLSNNIILADGQGSIKAQHDGTNWTMAGTITAANFITSSDGRLKQNIQPILNSLETVMQLDPVTYEKRADIESSDFNKGEMGFIAQDIQRVLPQLVREGKDKDKTLAVDYTSLIPLLTKAIQDQQQQILAQQKEIEELKELVKKNK